MVNSATEIEGADGPMMPPSYYAERFMTEFNENSQIFRQVLLPWINEIALAVPVIYEHRGRINFLSSALSRYRNQIRELESRADELEALFEGTLILDTNDLYTCLEGDGPC